MGRLSNAKPTGGFEPIPARSANFLQDLADHYNRDKRPGDPMWIADHSNQRVFLTYPETARGKLVLRPGEREATDRVVARYVAQGLTSEQFASLTRRGVICREVDALLAEWARDAA